MPACAESIQWENAHNWLIVEYPTQHLETPTSYRKNSFPECTGLYENVKGTVSRDLLIRFFSFTKQLSLAKLEFPENIVDFFEFWQRYSNLK